MRIVGSKVSFVFVDKEGVFENNVELSVFFSRFVSLGGGWFVIRFRSFRLGVLIRVILFLLSRFKWDIMLGTVFVIILYLSLFFASLELGLFVV